MWTEICFDSPCGRNFALLLIWFSSDSFWGLCLWFRNAEYFFLPRQWTGKVISHTESNTEVSHLHTGDTLITMNYRYSSALWSHHQQRDVLGHLNLFQLMETDFISIMSSSSEVRRLLILFEGYWVFFWLFLYALVSPERNSSRPAFKCFRFAASLFKMYFR